MLNRLLHIIPKSYRKKGAIVVATIFVRALLGFASLAALLPVLYLILDTTAIHTSKILENIYVWFGFGSDFQFVVAVTAAVVLFILLKNLICLYLYRFERDYIYSLYRYLSRNLYIDYFSRGLQFIKKDNTTVLARNVNVVCYSFVGGVLKPMATILSEGILFILLFIAIAIYNLYAALLTLLIFIPALIIYFGLIRGRVTAYGRAENEAQRKKYRTVIETYRGYADIELSGAFAAMLADFDNQMDKIISVGRKNATMSMYPQLFTELGLAIGMAALVCVSVGFGSADMKILFGIFAVAALRLLPSIRNIMSAWTSLRYNRYTIDVLATAPTTPNNEEIIAKQKGTFESKIEINNLCFRFEDSPTDTIHDFNLTINKGEVIGIKGRSGVGKTTLFNLLLGFYKPTAGTIAIDSEPLTENNRNIWQSCIGYVGQNVFLKDDTIKANIALGCGENDIDLDRVNSAVDMADLTELISALPKGLDSRIGECGALLSGGQRQRIGIARALYKRASVLFFDEATSSLDSLTEENINSTIKALSNRGEKLTIVIIAHRDSSLAHCNRIVELK